MRLTGTGGTVLVGNLNFRTAYGLPSHGFTVRAVDPRRRGVELDADDRRLRRRSMTESSTSELPALLDGVFTSAAYDNATNRCTADCGLSGVGAAASVPIGTDLVARRARLQQPDQQLRRPHRLADARPRSPPGRTRRLGQPVDAHRPRRLRRRQPGARRGAQPMARPVRPRLGLLQRRQRRQPQPVVRHRRHPPHRHRPGGDGPLRPQPARSRSPTSPSAARSSPGTARPARGRCAA